MEDSAHSSKAKYSGTSSGYSNEVDDPKIDGYSSDDEEEKQKRDLMRTFILLSGLALTALAKYAGTRLTNAVIRKYFSDT